MSSEKSDGNRLSLLFAAITSIPYAKEDPDVGRTRTGDLSLAPPYGSLGSALSSELPHPEVFSLSTEYVPLNSLGLTKK